MCVFNCLYFPLCLNAEIVWKFFTSDYMALSEGTVHLSEAWNLLKTALCGAFSEPLSFPVLFSGSTLVFLRIILGGAGANARFMSSICTT